ncbi:hypothetical protein [Planctomycetes bacterium K23_9]|uniref:Uncharacterized protein n=1 Tax=Stieleria marina TaxID=1930275 RepID=A0A517NT02_9BACT|nr:hypothetical protein K239x_21910 [Planctomycetes bacterium K23_9]
MDTARKDAYRYLLYWAMLDIRGIAWHRFQWWRPFRFIAHLRHVRRAGNIADAMHNLAQHAALDFDRFDEATFWDALDYAHSQSPLVDPSRYRQLFDDRLAELSNSS